MNGILKSVYSVKSTKPLEWGGPREIESSVFDVYILFRISMASANSLGMQGRSNLVFVGKMISRVSEEKIVRPTRREDI